MCVCVFLLYKLSCSPSSVVFISLEIIVSTLLVCEVLLRMMAFKKVRDSGGNND